LTFIFLPFPPRFCHRAAKLNLLKSKAVAQGVGGLRQALLFLAARGVEEVQLLAAVRERRESHADEPHFSGVVAVAREQFLHGFKHDGVEMRGLVQRVGARDIRTYIPHYDLPAGFVRIRETDDPSRLSMLLRAATLEPINVGRPGGVQHAYRPWGGGEFTGNPAGKWVLHPMFDCGTGV
jgi:hypothetical protein